jgi:predicted MPP superfamily phosphohydrolase
VNNIAIDSKPDHTITRRDFLNLLKIAGFSSLFAAAGGTYISQIEPGWLEVTQVSLTLSHLPKGFSGYRFVQISDIHMGSWMNLERLSQILDMVKGLEPQLVVISGDFVQGHGRVLTSQQEMVEMEGALTFLAGQLPTLAVLGNHDYRFGASRVLAMLERSKVRTMVNSVQIVQIGQEYLYFAGVDDVFEGIERIQEILPNIPENACAILVAHEPDFADQSAATGRFDLQISGHSHGGQVILPFIGPPVLPPLAHRYPLGLYRVRDMYQYTNRGVGMASPFIRFNCRPEITVYTLLAV